MPKKIDRKLIAKKQNDTSKQAGTESLEQETSSLTPVDFSNLNHMDRPNAQSLSRSNILTLQRTVGNQAILRMLNQRQHSLSTSIQRDDFTYDGRQDSNRVTGAPKTTDLDGGKSSSVSTTDTHGDNWSNSSTPNTTKTIFQGSTNTDTTTTHDVTGKTTQGNARFSGTQWNTATTDPTDTTYKKTTGIAVGDSSTSSETTENNRRDIAVSHSTSSSSSSGDTRTEKETRGTGAGTEIRAKERFSGTESSSNLTEKVDLNSAKISGGMDAFSGDRIKQSYNKGVVSTPTAGNQANTGLGVLDSLLTDKEFLKSLGIENPNLVEIKEKTLHEKGKAVKLEDNPGEAAELIFSLGVALANEDVSKRLEAVKKIEEKIIGNSGKKFKPVMALLKDYNAPVLTRWVLSGDLSVVADPVEILKEINLVTTGSGLLTKAGKSKKTTASESVSGGHTKTQGNAKVGVGGVSASLVHSSKLGIYDNRSRTDRGNLGKTGIELENTVANEFMAGARFDANAGFKLSAAGLNANLDASAMAGIQDTFTDNSSMSNKDGSNKLENKFKATGLAGVRGDLKSKAQLDATGINLGLDASAFAGLEGSIEDAVEFTYKGHKIFALKGMLKGSVGVGGRASFKLSLGSNGNLQLGFEVGATLGVGGSVGFEIEVNFKEIGALLVRKLVDSLKWLWKKIKSLFSSDKGEIKKDINEGATEVAKVGQEVAQIPGKLAKVQSVAANSPDPRPLKVLKGISSTAADLASDLSSAKAKLKDAASKDPKDKEMGKEAREATKEIKQEVRQAEEALKNIAGSV